MKLWLTAAALVATLLFFPALATALLGIVGTIAVWAAAQPTVWAFAAGILAYPRITDRTRRWTR